MDDDIVTRLRVITVDDSTKTIYQTMTDAADEIERLQAHLFYWKSTAHSMLQNFINQSTQEVTCNV